MRTDNHGNAAYARAGGFSLIEVMVAVVILATGLLALAALQGALARNSADAKARSAVMSALTSRMSQLRQSPGADRTVALTCAGGNWVCAAEQQAGVSAGGLTVAETVQTLIWKGGTFQAPAAGDLADAAYRRFFLNATWVDASGTDKSLGLRSDASEWIYGDGTGYPPPPPTTGSAGKKPVVRQANPSTIPGVIPIASGDQATAASNPKPLKEGANDGVLRGTRFDVMNYIPEGEGPGSTAKIIKRFDTKVIKCRCEFGAGGYSVAGAAQWPATWNGDTYAIPTVAGTPAGQTPNAGPATRKKKGDALPQSEQCTECCRDRHDTSTSPIKYDPRSTDYAKYNYDPADGSLTAVSSGEYVTACRVVRTGGLWVTTPDMYARQFGLLETETVGGKKAKTGTPIKTAVDAYTSYVKTYLKQYNGSASTLDPDNAMPVFSGSAVLNEPSVVNIASAVGVDDRYLHARGLYVDYLDNDAKEKIKEAIKPSNCPDQSKLEECILPHLPFTTINLTELAMWGKGATSATGEVISVNTTNTLGGDPTYPSGGRTKGVSDGTRSVLSSIRDSNSGLAVASSDLEIPGAVDAVDATTASLLQDSQSFQVGGTIPNPGGGKQYKISLSGGNDDPDAFHTLDIAALPESISTECFLESDGFRHCYVGSTTAVKWPVKVKLSNYQVMGTATALNFNVSSCTKVGSGSAPGTMDVPRPWFENYTASVGVGGPAPDASTVGNSGKKDEYHVFQFGTASGGGIDENQTIPFVFTVDSLGRQPAVLVSCTITKNTGKWEFSGVWSQPWL